MDEDRTKGAANQAKGQAKKAVGNMTGDTKTQAEGMYDKTKGKVQSAAGGLKDKARDALDDN